MPSNAPVSTVSNMVSMPCVPPPPPPPPPPALDLSDISFISSMPANAPCSSFSAFVAPLAALAIFFCSLDTLAILFFATIYEPAPVSTAKKCATALAAEVNQSITCDNTGAIMLISGAIIAPNELANAPVLISNPFIDVFNASEYSTACPKPCVMPDNTCRIAIRKASNLNMLPSEKMDLPNELANEFVLLCS